jgi:hypothetical protein
MTVRGWWHKKKPCRCWVGGWGGAGLNFLSSSFVRRFLISLARHAHAQLMLSTAASSRGRYSQLLMLSTAAAHQADTLNC